MPENDKKSALMSRFWKMSALAVGLLAVVVLTALISRRNDVSPAESVRLESLKNRAIVHLENAEFSQEKPAQSKLDLAAESFKEIASRLPGEVLGHRNLLITRLLQLDKKLIPAAELQEASDQCLRADADGARTQLLAARAAMLLEKPDVASASIRRAAALAPDDPVVWHEWHAVVQHSEVESERDLGREALARAFALAPDNLYLLANLLEEQAKAKDPALAATLATAREMILPVAAAVREQTRVDGDQLIAEALAAVEKQQWAPALRSCMRLKNVLLPQTATQTDKRRVSPHALEFVVHDFSARFYARLPRQETAAPGIDVKLSPAAEQPPESAGVADLALADFDLDGRLDLIVLRNASVEVYSRGPLGAVWRKTVESPLGAKYNRVLAVDLDQDAQKRPFEPAAGKAAPPDEPPAQPAGSPTAVPVSPSVTDVDLIVHGPAGALLLRNELSEDGTSRQLSPVVQDEPWGVQTDVLAVAAVDIYHDGDLDLVVSTGQGIRVWSNRGNMTFLDITSRSKLPPASLRASALTPVDLDRDVDLDIAVVGSSEEPAGYLENVRHGQLRWRTLGAPFDGLQSRSGLAVLEADGNRSWDLAAVGPAGAVVIRTDTDAAGALSRRAGQEVTAEAQAGLATWDFDNDGWRDLVTWGPGLKLFRGQPGGEFVEAPRLLVKPVEDVLRCEVGDLDGDGDEDLAVCGADRVLLLSNEGGNQNHWLNVALLADPDATDGQSRQLRVNAHGLGSLLEVRSGAHYQAQVASRQVAHVGLGAAAQADQARVVWTNGIPQDLLQPTPDLTVYEKQILLGSCPYLYTWTGQRFEFLTDCLWAAPLGLQFAENVFAPPRAWEYLNVAGDRLRAQNGRYRLQITEELWEAAYLDQVQLIAVDHPSDVEIYSNEKVAPPDLAQFKIHAARRRRTPAAAGDSQGRDCLSLIRERDGQYVRAFAGRRGMGLAHDHYLELDLGTLEDPGRVTLFLTGWIFPTGTSTNVGVSQNPDAKGVRPPSLWVPDGAGDWREAQPNIGFPGGKTKTIAVELGDVFPANDHRLRISTNMEIYWDEAFFTVAEVPPETRQFRLELVGADLHYRGFSERTPDTGYGPEHYDYERVSTSAKWPPMLGAFTRYGPVAELLKATDDQLVILGAGDEVSLEFKAPDEEPPPGWTRDFLLYNVGWDKDADLNTAYGQSVEPLPFGAMSGYPFGPDELPSNSPERRDYLRRYQNRWQASTSFWNRVWRADDDVAQ